MFNKALLGADGAAAQRSLAVGLLGGACLALVVGCGRAEPSQTSPSPVLRTTAVAAEPLPLALDSARLSSSIIESLRKRVLGRRASLPDVERVVCEVRPVLAAATRQPAAEKALRQIARDNRTSLEEARAHWIALHEADILLESGGNPEAVSVSEAVGVAQWIASTARRAGLSVNVGESERLTRKIDDLKRRIAWMEYLRRPDADPNAPGAPRVTRAEAEAKRSTLQQELEMLRAKRRRVDPRYDLRRALFAQTRYLLALYPRFPSLDWVFQAYHGGEAGARRTLQRYLGSAWPGSTAAAIRYGRAGKPLSFEHLSLTIGPRSHPQAFDYLYGRGDDHRYYWWKLRTAQEGLALYRRDPAAFRRQWEAFLPGRAKEAYWHPDGPQKAITDLPTLEAACRERRLLPVNARAEYLVRPAPSPLHAALRPEAKGALILLATAYRRAGGSGRLQIGDLIRTQEEIDREKARRPPSVTGPLWPPAPTTQTLPGGGPPPDFDFHATGLAFDVLRPPDPRQRKILECALDYLFNRQILWWMDVRDRGLRHYHVVPNPRYAAALARIGETGRVPSLPGPPFL